MPDEPEAAPPRVTRAVRAVAEPIRHNRVQAALVAAAGAGALAPHPFDALAVTALAVAIWDVARKK